VIERAVVLSEGETFGIDESWLAKKRSPTGARWRTAEKGPGSRPRSRHRRDGSPAARCGGELGIHARRSRKIATSNRQAGVRHAETHRLITPVLTA